MVAPFHIPEPIEVTVDLPFPPSINRTRRINWQKRWIATEWTKNADAHLMANKGVWNKHTIHGPCEAYIALNVEGGLGDLDNRIKHLLDYAQRIELLDNDNLIMKLTIEWVKPTAAPVGCWLILKELAG